MEKGRGFVGCGIDFRVYHSLKKVFLTGDPGPGDYDTRSLFENEISSCQMAHRATEPIFGKYNCTFTEYLWTLRERINGEILASAEAL